MDNGEYYEEEVAELTLEQRAGSQTAGNDQFSDAAGFSAPGYDSGDEFDVSGVPPTVELPENLLQQGSTPTQNGSSAPAQQKDASKSWFSHARALYNQGGLGNALGYLTGVSPDAPAMVKALAHEIAVEMVTRLQESVHKKYDLMQRPDAVIDPGYSDEKSTKARDLRRSSSAGNLQELLRQAAPEDSDSDNEDDKGYYADSLKARPIPPKKKKARSEYGRGEVNPRVSGLKLDQLESLIFNMLNSRTRSIVTLLTTIADASTEAAPRDVRSFFNAQTEAGSKASYIEPQMDIAVINYLAANLAAMYMAELGRTNKDAVGNEIPVYRTGSKGESYGYAFEKDTDSKQPDSSVSFTFMMNKAPFTHELKVNKDGTLKHLYPLERVTAELLSTYIAEKGYQDTQALRQQAKEQVKTINSGKPARHVEPGQFAPTQPRSQRQPAHAASSDVAAANAGQPGTSIMQPSPQNLAAGRGRGIERSAAIPRTRHAGRGKGFGRGQQVAVESPHTPLPGSTAAAPWATGTVGASRGDAQTSAAQTDGYSAADHDAFMQGANTQTRREEEAAAKRGERASAAALGRGAPTSRPPFGGFSYDAPASSSTTAPSFGGGGNQGQGGGSFADMAPGMGVPNPYPTGPASESGLVTGGGDNTVNVDVETDGNETGNGDSVKFDVRTLTDAAGGNPNMGGSFASGERSAPANEGDWDAARNPRGESDSSAMLAASGGNGKAEAADDAGAGQAQPERPPAPELTRRSSK